MDWSATSTLPPQARDVERWLRDGLGDVGDVRVVDASVSWDEDADGEPILRFVVTLADPPGDTWPVDDYLRFRGAMSQRASEVELQAPWHVSVQPETAEQYDSADLDTS